MPSPLPLDVVGLTRSLVDIDSTTGREGEAGQWLAAYLRRLGYSVSEQRVDDHRFNVFATLAPRPRVVFSTHFDTVPPFFPSRVEHDRIYGRGSCDAKGILAAQVAALERLRREGETRVGLLFVVGEERGSDGAKIANQAADGCEYLINGEPTDLRLGLATRGVLRLRVRATGRAAHSAFPELGDSAIDRLLDTLLALRSIRLPEDPELGRTHYTVGLISGGVAPNVVPPFAEAEVMFRTVGEVAPIMEAVAPLADPGRDVADGSAPGVRPDIAPGVRPGIAPGVRPGIVPGVSIDQLLVVPTVRLETVAGFAQAVFHYTTDIPFLARWGRPLLYGPGSIHVAHTADEFLAIDELRAAVDGNVRLAQQLLARLS